MAEALFQAFPELPEGILSRLRANLVCQDQLVKVAGELSISRYLRLGEGELKSGGQHRPYPGRYRGSALWRYLARSRF